MTRLAAVLLVALPLAALPLAAHADSPDDIPMKAGASAAATRAPAAPDARMPEGRDLLRAYMKACGGAEALQGVENAIVTTRYDVPAQSMKGEITLAFARPDKMRSSGEITGIGRIEQGYDGTTAWEVNALTGARLLKDAELEQLRSSETNVFNIGTLDTLYAEAKTVGRTTFAGADAWEVRLVARGGQETTAYFDPASGLMSGMKSTVASQFGDIPAIITLSDYKTFGKLKLPAKSTQSLLGGMVEATVTIEKVELNAPADRLPSFAPPPEVESLLAPAPDATPSGTGG